MRNWTDANRIGGIFLLVGAAAMPFIILDYRAVMAGLARAGAAPGAVDLVAHYQVAYGHLSRGWQIEVLALALIGAGALTRISHVARAGWALAAIGVALVLPMYPIMIGGYGSVLQSSPPQVAEFLMLRSIATDIFHAGMLVLSSGLALALWLERADAKRLLLRVVLLAGALLYLLAAAGFGLLHFGADIPLSRIGPFALLGFVSLAVFGASVAFDPGQIKGGDKGEA